MLPVEERILLAQKLQISLQHLLRQLIVELLPKLACQLDHSLEDIVGSLEIDDSHARDVLALVLG